LCQPDSVPFDPNFKSATHKRKAKGEQQRLNCKKKSTSKEETSSAKLEPERGTVTELKLARMRILEWKKKSLTKKEQERETVSTYQREIEAFERRNRLWWSSI